MSQPHAGSIKSKFRLESISMTPHSFDSSDRHPLEIAFVCTGNACRSQMAEGLARAKAGSAARIQSAGSHPAGYVHPLAVEAMREIGIDISGHTSKWIDDLKPEPDIVVTVCDNARDSCPRLRGRLDTLHWSMPDPVSLQDDPAAAAALARRVRDDLSVKIDALLSSIRANRASTSRPPETFRRPSRLKRWGVRLAVMLASLAVALLLAEAAFRVFAPQPTKFYAFDDFNLPDGSLRPGATGILCGVPVTINEDAERGRTFPRTKPPGVQRICVMGDSIVFGLGVADEDRYPVVLDRLLKERHPNQILEVIPVGQVAYRLSGYRTRLLPKALAYHPDIVVVGFVLNDFEPPPNAAAAARVTTLAPAPQSGFVATLRDLSGRLRKRSHLIYWLRKQIQVLFATKLMDHDELVAAWELECMYPDTPQFQAMWDYTVRQLDEIHSVCAAAGAQLVILVTPFDNQMSAERLAHYRKYLPDLPDSCLDNIPQQRLAEYCQSRALPFVDVTPVFKAHADRVFMQMLEGRVDPCHPTTEGHRLIAEALAGALTSVSGIETPLQP